MLVLAHAAHSRVVRTKCQTRMEVWSWLPNLKVPDRGSVVPERIARLWEYTSRKVSLDVCTLRPARRVRYEIPNL